jgi:putative membrane protein
MVQEQFVMRTSDRGPRLNDIFNLVLCLFAGLVLASCGNNRSDSVEQAKEQNADAATVSESDMKFAVEAASGGMMEVQLGRLALEQASAQAVKDFAQTMIDDHSKANAELQDVARRQSIELPATPGADHQNKIDQLAKKKGRDFDRAYVDLMVSDHESDVAAFDNQSRNGSDPSLREWAAEKLPVLRHHLDMAKEMSNTQ